MLASDGRVFVLDCAVSRLVERLTGRRAGIGTPGFMSPEQASGGTIDERSDIYGLGATLRALRTQPSTEERRFLDRCLNPRPEDRYPSMEAAAQALTRIARPRRLTRGRLAAVAALLLALLAGSEAVRVGRGWLRDCARSAARAEAAELVAAGRQEEAYAALAPLEDESLDLSADLALSIGGFETEWERRGHSAGVTGVGF